MGGAVGGGGGVAVGGGEGEVNNLMCLPFESGISFHVSTLHFADCVLEIIIIIRRRRRRRRKQKRGNHDC